MQAKLRPERYSQQELLRRWSLRFAGPRGVPGGSSVCPGEGLAGRGGAGLDQAMAVRWVLGGVTPGPALGSGSPEPLSLTLPTLCCSPGGQVPALCMRVSSAGSSWGSAGPGRNTRRASGFRPAPGQCCDGGWSWAPGGGPWWAQG